MLQDAGTGEDVDVYRRLDDLQARVDGLTSYQEMDAQTTMRIEHQIELLQMQLDKLTELIGRIGSAVGVDN